jgi:hypothetical protein
MRPARSSRYVIALLALFSMLFMQMAVASYVCPMLTTEPMAAMTDCAGMEMEQPVLCIDQAHAIKQSADKPESPPVQPFIAAGLILTLCPVEANSQAASMPSRSALLRTTAPPLPILHCCFRI